MRILITRMRNLLKDNFEKLYCINLDSRPDRWALAQEEFKKYGIEDIVERFPGLIGNKKPGWNRRSNDPSSIKLSSLTGDSLHIKNINVYSKNNIKDFKEIFPNLSLPVYILKNEFLNLISSVRESNIYSHIQLYISYIYIYIYIYLILYTYI